MRDPAHKPANPAIRSRPPIRRWWWWANRPNGIFLGSRVFAERYRIVAADLRGGSDGDLLDR